MKQRPIIFNTEMVRAIIDGRKTQTRRPAKNISFSENGGFVAEVGGKRWMHGLGVDHKSTMQNILKSKYGPNVFKGDQLYVRETFCIGKYEAEDRSPEYGGEMLYISQCTSDNNVIFKQHALEIGCSILDTTWKPSIHMPRSAARIILEVTDIRVERLNDISEQDAKAEGFEYPAVPGMGWKFNARHNFLVEWDQIYGNRSSNPWVWVIEFKVISTTGGAA